MINKGKNTIFTRKKRGIRKEQCTITTHKNLSVKIDYISIVFDTVTAEDVIMHILGLPTDIFNVYPASVKFKTYQARWQIGDIYVSGDARKTEDNPQGLGCYLVMTGRGCDDIFRILDSRNYTFGDMFRRCERRYGLDNFHFTRLDIAIDDKNEKPFFTIEQIKKKCKKEEFISNSEGYHFDESKFDDFDTAKTVYIGAGKSGLSYRFYDKDKEVCSKHNKTLDEVGSWKRTEMQLRDDKAHAFAMTFKVPKLHNSLEETQQWLTEGGVISAVKSFYFLEEHDALGGLEKVGTMLDRARYSSSLSSKLTAHLQRIDRTDLIPYIQYDTKHGKGGI